MFEKKEIETILRINGVNQGASDEDVRSVLLSANYSAEEVDEAINTLKNNTNKPARVDGLHKVFRSDESLKPTEISGLLGIEVDIDQVTIHHSRTREMLFAQITIVTLLAIALAAGSILFAMYFYKVGVFHPTVSAFRI